MLEDIVKVLSANVISIHMRVTANARKESLTLGPTGLAIKVAAPAVENKANERIVALLSVWLKIPKRSIVIRRGLQSKNKQIEISGFTRDEMVQKIGDTVTAMDHRI